MQSEMRVVMVKGTNPLQEPLYPILWASTP